MGKTSAAVKNKYAAKTYDRITILVPKGQKDIIKQKHQSVNAYINKLIADDMGKEESK